ncbi:enoyl-CoA hydratase/isomerase family protein [Bacillus sp. FSL W7-1321]
MSTNMRFEKSDTGVGVITLAREKALNSLSYDMVSGMLAQLQQWKQDDEIALVLLEGAGSKAFCAGGDIKALYSARDSKNGLEEAKHFFAHEYELDLLVATYPKPIVALLDGIVMGGGVGLSYGASHRIVTDTTKWSMPEMNISFFPDVGACYFLSLAPGYTGRYAALTAAMLTGEDAIFLGCADYYTKKETMEPLRSQLLNTDWTNSEQDLNQALHLFLQSFIAEPPKSELAMLQPKIDQHFSHKTVEAIIASLEEAKGDPFAQDCATILRSKSPLSLKVTLAHLKQSKTSTLEETYETDKRLALRFLRSDDFYEGVRSVLIDKTRMPNYQYKTIEEVPDELALSFFREL